MINSATCVNEMLFACCSHMASRLGMVEAVGQAKQ